VWNSAGESAGWALAEVTLDLIDIVAVTGAVGQDDQRVLFGEDDVPTVVSVLTTEPALAA
jgi:hypothetical protein